MRKFTLFLLLFVIGLAQCCYAVNSKDIENAYYKYYTFSKTHNAYNFNNYTDADYKKLSSENKQEYKTIKKINNLYLRGKYNKILKKYPNFTPARFSLYLLDISDRNYYAALNQLGFIRNQDKHFDKNYLAELIFMGNYKLKQYDKALDEVYLLSNKQNFYAYIADCYLNIGNLTIAAEYALKTPKTDKNYYLANEVLFKVYYRQNNIQKAKSLALYLIKLNPMSPDNYIRYAKCEDNKNIKLKYLYDARNRIYTVNYRTDINADIINLEQAKINDACNSMKVFTEKPDWNRIIEESNYNNYSYWEKRQDSFFKDTNECIKRYSGTERAKCFESVTRNQYRLTEELNKKIAAEKEQAYRNTVVQQNNEMIKQQYVRNIELMNINNNLMQQNNQLQNINNQLQFNRYRY